MSPPDVPEETLGAVGRLLARRMGLRLNPGVAGRLARSVVEEAEARRLALTSYSDRIETDPVLFQGLVDRITVQETSFFRDPGQLEAFRTLVLPRLPAPVRVWSAGCSNGHEPYTLAMLLMESGVADWQVTATDVSSSALDRTARARYSAKELQPVPPALRARYLRPAGDDWEVVGELRERVAVVHHNLVTDSPPFRLGQCDVVFCRNVLIYVSHDPMVATLERLARQLRPPGWLFLGYSESLLQVTDAFELARLGDSFAYRLRQEALPAAVRGPAAPGGTRPHVRPPPRGQGGHDRPARKERVRPGTPPRPNAEAGATSDLVVAGHEAMEAGDFAAAVVAFRKLAYLESDQPLAHLQLGLALEASGDAVAARRAFSVARAMLDHGDQARIEAALEGYHVGELSRLLDAKLAAR